MRQLTGLGLFRVIGSYFGQFMVSATSCREMMPDPAFFRQCLPCQPPVPATQPPSRFTG
jgi:hypothetical protein